MRKSITLVMFVAAIPCLAQVTGGRETVQDAIRFERQKEAAAARQARIESRQSGSSNADRSAERPRPAKKPKAKTGTATRTDTTK